MNPNFGFSGVIYSNIYSLNYFDELETITQLLSLSHRLSLPRFHDCEWSCKKEMRHNQIAVILTTQIFAVYIIRFWTIFSVQTALMNWTRLFSLLVVLGQDFVIQTSS